MSKEFTRRLKAELNQTEHLNIYTVPCPECGAAVVATARIRDDPQAASQCAKGHEFTRAQAFEAYNASVRAQVQINAAYRLKASLKDKIEDVRETLAVDGYCIQHSNQSLTFQFYVHPSPSYLRALDRAYGPHREGKGNSETIYRWNVKGLGLNFYLPDDTNKAARIQVYNRGENYASIIEAYDRTWINKMNQHKQAHPKYQGQQKPSQLVDEHIFTLAPSALARRLKALYKDDFRSAMGALTVYKNRAGKNLLSPDRDRIDKAKEQLRKLYGKPDEDQRQQKNQSPESEYKSKPANERPPVGSKPTTRII